MKTRKLLPILMSAFFILSACSKVEDYIDPLPHTCNCCPTCGKCLNETCQELVCLEKCTCNDKKDEDKKDEDIDPIVHTCSNVCETCEKCTDLDCADPVCAYKCECPPPEYSYHKKFNSQGNVALVDSEEFLEFWNYSSDIQINLDFKQSAFKTMCELQGKSLPKFADVYFPADLKIKMNDKEYTYEEVGVRLKGNTSRRTMLNSSGNISQQAHMKVSLKATFDDELYDKDPKVSVFKKTWEDANERKERKDRTLFGMEKFDLKYVTRNSGFGGGFGGSGSDGCFAREVVAFDMFRKQGMLAPHANIVQVTLNNEVSTKTFRYQTIECVDKVFLKRHFSKADAKGDLYKCGVQDHWIADFQRRKTVEELEDENGKAIGGRIANGWIGVEDPYNQYFPSYQLKTNDDLGEDSDFSKMVGLINTLTDCLNNKGSKEELEKVLDMEQFLEYSAVSYMLGNFDDLRYNTNNSYVYFVPSTGKAVVIAYDYDWSLGLATGKDMSKVKPFDTYTMSGNISNLYKATLLNDSDINLSLNYSKKDYQDKFLAYMGVALKDKCLDSKYLYSIVDQFKYVGTTFPKERTNVASYMEKKTATILEALGNK
ncbi:MAG: CotH kinase family protein [Bacilli bacterium]|nr:CotH kinase family protein [Bacilli bacterium]